MKIHKDLAKSILICLGILFLIAGIVQASEQVTVQRVIDGDTLKIIYQGQEESVRLIGIDTPESRTNKKALKDSNRTGQDMQTTLSMGKEATEYVKGT
jgi:micrococcal nuclease